MKEKGLLSFLNFGANNFEQDVYRRWREGLMRPILNIALVFGFIAFVAGIVTNQGITITLIFIGAYISLALIALLPTPFWLRAGILVLAVYALGLNEFLSYGIEGDGIFFFLALVILTTMFFSPRGGIIALTISLITFGLWPG